MKKTLFVLFVAFVFAFAACGGPAKDSVHIQPQVSSFVGVIEESSPGAYTLFVAQGGDLNVKSLAFDLSEDRYLGNKVEVVGVLDIESNVLEITGISVLEMLREDPEDEDVDEDEDEDEDEYEDNDYLDEDPDSSHETIGNELPAIDMNLTSFESLPYHFRGTYPSNWYYAGSSSTETGVLHHYGFSSEPVTPENKIIGLDVIEKSLLDEQISRAGVDKIILNGQEFYVLTEQSNYMVFTSTGGRHYKVSGHIDYNDLILNMSAGIEPLEPSAE